MTCITKLPAATLSLKEYLCAVAIDMNPKVEFWIRIIEKSDDSFRLETPFGFFYPDFYVQLEDGRRFIVEYKRRATVEQHRFTIKKRHRQAMGKS